MALLRVRLLGERAQLGPAAAPHPPPPLRAAAAGLPRPGWQLGSSAG